MESERVKRGETFSFLAEFEDVDGNPVAVDETWSFGLRICKGCIGGETVADVPVTLTDGALFGTYDTEDMERGLYFYDIRATDPDGNDEWSEPVKLTIEATSTPHT